jgi:hypothetical protein
LEVYSLPLDLTNPLCRMVSPTVDHHFPTEFLPTVDSLEPMLCIWQSYLPSGKLTLPWKITIVNWYIHYKWPFSIAMLNYQRVSIEMGNHGTIFLPWTPTGSKVHRVDPFFFGLWYPITAMWK